MKSLNCAYLAFKHRGFRGEYDHNPRKAVDSSTPHDPLLMNIGDPIIYTGLRSILLHATVHPMTGSTMSGSKP
jgi:hypothetical protein